MSWGSSPPQLLKNDRKMKLNMPCKINGVGVYCIRNAAVSNVTMYEKIVSFSAFQRSVRVQQVKLSTGPAEVVHLTVMKRCATTYENFAINSKNDTEPKVGPLSLSLSGLSYPTHPKTGWHSSTIAIQNSSTKFPDAVVHYKINKSSSFVIRSSAFKRFWLRSCSVLTFAGGEIRERGLW